MSKCRIEGCTNAAVAKGLCAKHYMRVVRTGNAMATHKRGPKPKPGGRAAEFAQLRAENERLRQRVKQQRREYREAMHSGVQAVAKDFRTASAHCAACADKDRTIEKLEAELKQVIRVYKDNRGLMTTKMYKQILGLLHPDRVTDVELKRRYSEAFMFWKGLEEIIPFELTFEERTGTPRAKMPPPMPKTTREMAEAGEKVRQERSERAKRAAAKRKAKKGQ